MDQRFCVIGAGAIGGFIAARLALAGRDVTLFARGATLESIRRDGLRVRSPDGREAHARIHATDDYAGAGKFDVVMVAVKAHQLAEVAPFIEPLCRDAATVVPLQNGVPFWYFHGYGGPLEGRALESVDPGGRIRDAIPAHRILGSVTYIAVDRVAPGTLRHATGERLQLGELVGPPTPRIQELAAALRDCGFIVEPQDDIRAGIWVKLWGNVSFNPVSALTRANMAEICANPHSRALMLQLMREAQGVAEALGVRFAMTPERRLAGAERVGPHKTSMLQDLEAGRTLELDALVGAVVELGELMGRPTPAIAAIYRAAKLLDATVVAPRPRVASSTAG